jgi:hypothetical protein
MSTPSRWVLLNRANPMYVLGEKCAYFLDWSKRLKFWMC